MIPPKQQTFHLKGITQKHEPGCSSACKYSTSTVRCKLLKTAEKKVE